MTFLWLIITCNTDWRHGPGCAGLITILVLRCWPGVIFIRMAEIPLSPWCRKPVSRVSWCDDRMWLVTTQCQLLPHTMFAVYPGLDTGHRIGGSPPRVITAHHSPGWSLVIFPSHTRHSSLQSANATHFLPQPFSCPPPSLSSFLPLPPTQGAQCQ